MNDAFLLLAEARVRFPQLSRQKQPKRRAGGTVMDGAGIEPVSLSTGAAGVPWHMDNGVAL
jgi:hypothetical protein